MSEQTRRVIEAYAKNHDAQCFAEDATFTQMPVPQPAVGRPAIAQLLQLFYADAFSDAHGAIRSVAADTEKDLGFVEFTFRGRHTGELMGIAPTGRNVDIPMLAVYEVAGASIRHARLYYDMATLMRQLGRAQ